MLANRDAAYGVLHSVDARLTEEASLAENTFPEAPHPDSFVHDGCDDGNTDWKEECRTYFGTGAMDRALQIDPELTWEQMYEQLYRATNG